MTCRIVLVDPKYPHNVGQAVRAASCFGADGVYVLGERVKREVEIMSRLPREERLREYRPPIWINALSLSLLCAEQPLVAVEIVPGAQVLPVFNHPAAATYVFGPEDGTLPKDVRALCHAFVRIPSYHCLNLAAAVYVVLYDRMLYRWREYGEPPPELKGKEHHA